MQKPRATTSLRLEAAILRAADALIPKVAAEALLVEPAQRRLSRHAILVRALTIGLREIAAQPGLLRADSDWKSAA